MFCFKLQYHGHGQWLRAFKDFFFAIKDFLVYCYLDSIRWYDLYAEISVFQLTSLKSVPSCYFKSTLNSYNFTILLSAWILLISCNISVNLGPTISGLLRLKKSLLCFNMFMDYFIKDNNDLPFVHSYNLWWVTFWKFDSVATCL